MVGFLAAGGDAAPKRVHGSGQTVPEEAPRTHSDDFKIALGPSRPGRRT